MDNLSVTTSHWYSLIPVLSEYESTIDALTKEVIFYCKEQENLRNEITILISENKILAGTINQLMEWQNNHQCEAKSGKLKDPELIQNLKTQLSCIQKEKDIAIELWQTALKGLDNLEGTLGLFEGRTHGYLPKAQVSIMKTAHENKIAELNEKVQKLQTNLDNCKKDLNTRNVELSKTLERQSSTHTVAKCLENDVQNLYKEIQDVTKVRDELQVNLAMKNQTIAELETKDIEAKRKVLEALQVVEAACFEKNGALARESEAKNEVLKISKTLTEIMNETTENVKTEIENIKQGYNNKLKKVQDDVLNLQKQLKEKDAELIKCLQESVVLNQELDRVKKGHICVEESHTSKLLILEKNLESTFQKLLLSEKKNLQLDAEKEFIKSDLEQMANCYKSDIRTRETEKEIMKKQLSTLKSQLRTSNTKVVQAMNKADTLKAQMKHLDMVIQEKLKLQHIMHDQELSKSIEGIQINSTHIQSELQHHIREQRRLNKKIKKEMIEIIDELERKMEELKNAKRSLEHELKHVLKDNLYYKENLQHFCTKVVNLAEVTSEVSVRATEECNKKQLK